MKNRLRDYEELITLQDKAIAALEQANIALQLALDALICARREHGSLGNLFGQPAAWPPPNPYTMPGGSVPNTGLFTYNVPAGGAWGGSPNLPLNGTGVVYSNGVAGSAQHNMTVTGQKQASKEKLLQVLQDWQAMSLASYNGDGNQ